MRKGILPLLGVEVPAHIESGTLLTSHECGALIQVNPSSINKWVKEKRIAAHRTPGGHRRIRAGDFVAFLSTHGMPVPEKLKAIDPQMALKVVMTEDQLKLLVESGVPPAVLKEIRKRTRRA